MESAKDKIQLMKLETNCRYDRHRGVVVVDPSRPVVVNFSEGEHEYASLRRDEILDEKKKKILGRVYYPPPLQLYCPAGNIARSSYPFMYADIQFQRENRYQVGLLLAPLRIQINMWTKISSSSSPGFGTVSRITPAPVAKLPRRLLDVGFREGDAIKLIESSKLESKDQKYVAVSHCWCTDEDRMFKTLDSNLRDRLQSISMTGMPKVLKDSIKVTRALGVQYLWIDTVCLIQDNPDDDKGKEISRMGDYYSNAFFTIAASSSTSSIVPFVTERNPYYEPDTLPFGKDGRSKVQVRRLGLGWHFSKRVRSVNSNDI